MGLKFTFSIIMSILSFKIIVGRGNTSIFYSKSGYSIVGISSLKSYVSKSKIECAVQCAIEEGCRTASFNNSAHMCYLHATDECPKIETSETSSVLYIGKPDGECIAPWNTSISQHTYTRVPADTIVTEDHTYTRVPADTTVTEDNTYTRVPADTIVTEDHTYTRVPADTIVTEDHTYTRVPADTTVTEDHTYTRVPADTIVTEDPDYPIV